MGLFFKTQDEKNFKFGSQKIIDNANGLTFAVILKANKKATSLVMPGVYKKDRVELIEENAFSQCNQLSDLTLPVTVKDIRANAFENCTSLRVVNYLGGVNDWFSLNFATEQSNPLYYGASLNVKGEDGNHLVIKDGLQTVKKYSLYNCKSVQKITIPTSVEKFEKDAFYGCENLKEVHYQGTLSQWVALCFENPSANPLCNGASLYIEGERITELCVGQDLESINDYAFAGIKNLLTVTVTKSAKSMGECVFNNSEISNLKIEGEGITDATLNGLRRVNTLYYYGTEDMFITSIIGDCSCFKKTKFIFDVNASKEKIEEDDVDIVKINSFKFEKTKLTFEFGNFQYKGEYHTTAYDLVSYTGEDEEVEIPEFYLGHPVVNVRYSAFNGLKNLKKVTIPQSVIRLEESSFLAMDNLLEINYLGDINSWMKMGLGFSNRIYLKSASKPNVLIKGKEITEVTIPSSVTELNSALFYNFKKLSKVKIEGSVKRISEYCFAHTAVNSIDFIKGVEEIGAYAFSHCSQLKCANIPNGVKKIGISAFRYSAVEEISIPKSVIEVESGILDGTPYSGKFINKSSIYYCDGVLVNVGLNYKNGLGDKVVIEEGTRVIPGCAFYNSGINEIVLPDSIEYIGSGAFDSCKNLTQITLPKNLKELTSSVFANCYKLKEVTFGDKLEVITGFSGCKLLQSVTLPNSVKEIKAWAFRNCSCLESIEVGNSLESISGWAFDSCTSLTSITLPKSLTYIGPKAFKNCPKLEKIIYTGTVEEWKKIHKNNWNDTIKAISVECSDGEVPL